MHQSNVEVEALPRSEVEACNTNQKASAKEKAISENESESPSSPHATDKHYRGMRTWTATVENAFSEAKEKALHQSNVEDALHNKEYAFFVAIICK